MDSSLVASIASRINEGGAWRLSVSMNTCQVVADGGIPVDVEGFTPWGRGSEGGDIALGVGSGKKRG